MNKTINLAVIAALIAAIGGSFFIPGPTEMETEKAMANWKQEVVEMAQKDHEMLRTAGAFTK